MSIREPLECIGEGTFESEEQLRQVVVSQMPRDCVGRTSYCDRGDSKPEAAEAAKRADDQTAATVEDGEATDPETKQQPDRERAPGAGLRSPTSTVP
jgi:hypothetical protein